MGENQGRATHFFALDDLTVIAVFDEAVEIAVVGQCAVGSAGRGFFIDVIERRKVSRVAERVIGIARLVERERVNACHFIARGERRQSRHVRCQRRKVSKGNERQHDVRQTCGNHLRQQRESLGKLFVVGAAHDLV